MKILSALSLFLLISLKLSAQQFTLSGKITGAQSGDKIFLRYFNNQGNWTTDSTVIENGAFSFKGNISGVERANLFIRKNVATIYLEPANMTADGNYSGLEKIAVSGSKTQDENAALQVDLNKISNEFAPVSAKINAAKKEYELAKKNNRPEKELDSLNENLLALEKLRDPFAGRYEAVIKEFIETHPNSVVSAAQMLTYVPSWSLTTVQQTFNRFTSAVKNSTLGKTLAAQIDKRAKAAAETVSKNFTAVDLKGKTISLTDLKGQYVILDFWGSWCVPCRAAMPHLKQLYTKYHKNGMDVIAVSIQEPSDLEWKRAITKDKTDLWHNIRGDINGLSLHNLYSVDVFPTKILIDKNGNMIGRYDGDNSELLDKKLAEIFGK